MVKHFYLFNGTIGKDEFNEFLEKSKEDACVKYARAKQQMEKMGMGPDEINKNKCSGLKFKADFSLGKQMT